MNTRNIARETRTLRQLAGRGEFSPDRSLIAAIDSRRFPIADNLFFGFCPQHLANKEWQRCLRLFEDRIRPEMPQVNAQNFYQTLMMEWMRVTQELDRVERPVKQQLIELAQQVVREMYNMEEEDVELNADIRPPHDNGFDSRNSEDVPDFTREAPEMDNDAPGMGGANQDEEEISEEREEYIRIEAQKRIIMNGLAHGSAIHIWKSSYYIAQERLNELNPDLIDLYDKYAALVSFLMWMFPPEQMKQMIESNQAVNQGWNKAGFKPKRQEQQNKENEDERPEPNDEQPQNNQGPEEQEEVPVITGVGMNFPVLLHELAKGVVELISYHGIPQDFTVKEMQLYYAIADEYTLEPWFYFLAPTLWSELLETINGVNRKVAEGSSDLNDETTIPETIQYLCSLEYDDLSELCVYVVHDQEKAIASLEEGLIEVQEEMCGEDDYAESILNPESEEETEESVEDSEEVAFEDLGIEELKATLLRASEEEDYVLAAKCRDRIKELED